MTRISPIEKPYGAENDELFDLVMPPGMEPLLLFRVLARNQRIFPRFMRAGVLDKGPIPIRDREIVIHRTTANCGAEYEWGVQVAAFGRPLGLDDPVLRATVDAKWCDPIFTPRQQALVRLCDELHEGALISRDCWDALAAHFGEEDILELIYIVGQYHAVSFLVNGLALDREPFAPGFEDLAAATPADPRHGTS